MSALDAVEGKLRALDAARVTSSGTWSAAQVFRHCAQSVNYSLDGFPQMKPLPVRVIGRMVMKRFLAKGSMSHAHDAAIPGAPALDVTDAASTLAELLASIARFRSATITKPHFAYGAVDHATYATLHAMHIDDHLTTIR